jgi:hypothetical protein
MQDEQNVREVGLFTGVVCAQQRKPNGGIDQTNEGWTVTAYSEGEAIGYAVKQTLAKYPGWAIVYQAMHDITEIALATAALKAKEQP